jgi:glycerophosphoryl diester phosphodiesterase
MIKSKILTHLHGTKATTPRRTPYLFVALVIAAIPCLPFFTISEQSKKKILIAHRGASAYAPEHTLEAYRLAIEQGADFVEQDLQITKDNVLVCLHDLTLERTTNVEEVFPDRFSKDTSKHWYVSDFTLGEIKQLDAGSWFNEKFKGAKVPTWQEAIDLIRGKAGLYPETKTPGVYGKRGFDMEKLVVETLKKNRLETPNADSKTPVIIQSFSPESLLKLRSELKVKLPLVLLISFDQQNQWLSVEGIKKAKSFANGIGPAKELVDQNPQIVKWAHEAGLTVTPYTFRSSSSGRFQDVREEMKHFLFKLGVDAVFTDNPDMFPK